MANSVKLRKAAAKFRKTEPALHALYSEAIGHMASFIKKSGAPEVVAKVCNGHTCMVYANE